QLGYNGALFYGTTTSFGTDYYATILNGVSCFSSSLLTLEQCSFTTTISSTCFLNSNDVIVDCYTSRIWDNPYPGQIRLAGGIYTSYGRLEVYCNGEWGTVCDDTFDATDAKVVCRQLGYSNFAAAHSGPVIAGSTSQPIWLDRVHCNSSYTCLATCKSCPSLQYYNCFHSKDVEVACEFDSSEMISSNTLSTCTTASTSATTNTTPGIVGLTVGIVVAVITILT
uniref:SRCR domain-containing protein n=1 Tax=Amphimedon queenslandica TaxID=400682 RepID=A0A1X7T0Z8_AMPQE